MSTLRITNIEAKADPSSPTVDEKIKLTNSNGDILVHIDGKTSGITTIGINTTAGNIKFDQNSNVVVTGIITATKFVGTIEPTTLTVGGDLTIPDKIVHTGDTNTSIRFPAADTITAETAGSERLRVDSDGRLGLGTDNPENRISVFNPGYTGLELQSNRTTATDNIGGVHWKTQSTNVAYLQSLVDGTVRIRNTSSLTERLRITSAGRVAIGNATNNASPTALFGVIADDGEANDLYVGKFHNLEATAGQSYGVDIRAGSNSTDHGFRVKNRANDTTQLIVRGDGNIGIGTDNPNGLLALTASSGRILTLRNSTTGSASGDGSYLALNGSDLQIANAESANLILYTADTERVRITSDGKMGVGCTPEVDFQVRNANGGTLKIGGSGTGATGFQIQYNNSGNTTTEILTNYRATSGNASLKLDTGTFLVATGTSGTERLRINSSGDATFRQKVFIGDLYTGGEILSLGKSSGTSYIAFHNGGANMGFIGYADQLISGGASNELGIRSQDDIRFSTGGNTERFRISDSTVTCATGVGMAIDGGTSQQPTDSSLLVTKQNNNDWALQVRNYEGSSTDYGFYTRSKNAASYAIAVYDADNSAFRFRVNGGGNIYATNTTVSSISDQRLKENIVDANSQWDDIKALRFRNFNWREDSGFSDGRTYLGLIAQEVEPISPNLVDINAQSKEDIENEVPDPEYKNVKYSIVWMKAVKALQEAQTRIETLETQLTDALARITALEGS